jgi:hypothetical protein
MKGNQRTYSISHFVSAAFLILTLLWLTISAPFVYASQQEQAKIINTAHPLADSNEEETSNPFGNTTEEKAPSSTTFSEEYLHNHFVTDHFFSIILRSHKSENVGIYIAFHGELHVPPPNAA